MSSASNSTASKTEDQSPRPNASGPSRVKPGHAPARAASPGARQAQREAAEAAALAELEGERLARRNRSARLRKLRLSKEKS